MAAMASFSYKEEESENQTDSDDLLEITATAQAADEEDDNHETIEKVIQQRVGRKGGKCVVSRYLSSSFICSFFCICLWC